MSAPQPGWYPDPSDGRRWRWWSGSMWTDRIAVDGRQERSPLPAAPRRGRRLPIWGWVAIAVIALPVLLALWPLLGAAAVVVGVTGIVALTTRTRTWLRFGSTGAAIATTAVAALIVAGTGGLTAVAMTSAPTSEAISEPLPWWRPAEAAGSPSVSTERPTASPLPSSKPTPKSTPSAKPTRTATPSPTPVTRVSEVSVSSAIPFERAAVDDPNLPRGQSRIDVAGVDGEKVSVFRETTVDGVVTHRDLLRESVSREAVTEITANGTLDPPPPAQAPASDGCHPSYADACVPIDSDVDCAGGKGNGPSYFQGVARVVGPDVYDLDRDGDGWACNG